MKNKLYLECYSGISGDMTVAALIDLGADKEALSEALSSLPVSGFKTEISRVKKSGIDSCDFNVILDDDHKNYDHDMDYLYNTHHHHHEHNHNHNHHHEHRNLKDILEIINNSKLTDRAKNIATDIFTTLAKAEAKAHGTDIDNVHFHEVGAVDSIVDIISIAFCIDNLNISDVIASELYEGTGTVHCQHGILPVPVPAVLNIAADNNIKLHITDCKGEYVTPTGAAAVAVLKTHSHLPKSFTIKKIGIGAGKREQEMSGILRAMLIEEC